MTYKIYHFDRRIDVGVNRPMTFPLKNGNVSCTSLAHACELVYDQIKAASSVDLTKIPTKTTFQSANAPVSCIAMDYHDLDTQIQYAGKFIASALDDLNIDAFRQQALDLPGVGLGAFEFVRCIEYYDSMNMIGHYKFTVTVEGLPK